MMNGKEMEQWLVWLSEGTATEEGTLLSYQDFLHSQVHLQSPKTSLIKLEEFCQKLD